MPSSVKATPMRPMTSVSASSSVRISPLSWTRSRQAPSEPPARPSRRRLAEPCHSRNPPTPGRPRPSRGGIPRRTCDSDWCPAPSRLPPSRPTSRPRRPLRPRRRNSPGAGRPLPGRPRTTLLDSSVPVVLSCPDYTPSPGCAQANRSARLGVSVALLSPLAGAGDPVRGGQSVRDLLPAQSGPSGFGDGLRSELGRGGREALLLVAQAVAWVASQRSTLAALKTVRPAGSGGRVRAPRATAVARATAGAACTGPVVPVPS